MTTISPLPMRSVATLDEAIGLRVRQLLIGRGTQADLAEALHLKQPDVSRRLRGVTAWRASEVATVAQLLGVPIGVLYGESPASDADGASHALARPEGLEPPTFCSGAESGPLDAPEPTDLPSVAAPMVILAGLLTAAIVREDAR